MAVSEIDEPIKQYLHVADMKAELHKLSDGTMTMGMSGDVDQRVEEAFLESVLAYERAEQVPFRELLERDGVIIPAPDELTDEELSEKLEEVIQAMAKRHGFLECTDHLTDRELYTHLVEISLEETMPDLPLDDLGNCHIDITGGCSEEDIETYLRYYADEGWRAHWAESFPDDAIPPHEDPPYDRDRHLPKPTPPPNPYDDDEVSAEWCAECRTRLLAQLAEEGVVHGPVGGEPVSYAPPIASVWAIESKDCPGIVEWWALIGEVPVTLMSANEVSGPRAFLRAISRRWNGEVDELESARRKAREAAGCDEPPIPVEPFHMRRWYARIFEKWAADDSAWDEEWRNPDAGG
jgi:hypothetical protein